MTSWRRRALAIATAVLTTVAMLTSAAPAQADPTLRIRVPLFAAPGNIPPAIVGSPTVVAGTTYRVYDAGGTQVRTGRVQNATVPVSPSRDAEEVWSHYGLVPLNGLPAGRYRVRVGSVYSVFFTVKAGGWQDVVKTLLPIYRANADGSEVATPYHAASHLNDATSPIANGPHAGETVDVRGGWMDAGDQLKFTVTIAYATAMLELAGRNEPGLRSMLWARAAIGIRFLLKAHPRAGVFVAQVGDATTDHNLGFRDPAGDDSSPDPAIAHRSTQVLTDSTGGSDVAAMAAAALALSARHHTGAYRVRLVRQARAWLAEAERLAAVWTNCCYQQSTWRDDAAFAHAALWRATGDVDHAAAAIVHLDAATAFDTYWRVTADGFEMSALPAAEMCGVLGAPAAPAVQRDRACDVLRRGGSSKEWEVQNRTAFGRVGLPQWASVRTNDAGALTLLLADREGTQDFTAAMLRSTGWSLGVNPWGVRMQVVGSTSGATVTGGVLEPYHWTNAIGRPLPVGAVPGGPATEATINSHRSYCCADVVLGPFDTAQQVYHRADAQDYVMNEIGIGYNAPALLHYALLSPG